METKNNSRAIRIQRTPQIALLFGAMCTVLLALCVALGVAGSCNKAFAEGYSPASAEFSDLAGQTVATSASDAAANHVHVYDNANILSSSAKAELSAQISQMITDYGYDIVIFTDTSTHGCSDRRVYAADFYERNHYGIGSDITGMAMFICMEQGNRGWFTVATGSCQNKVNSAAVNYVDDDIESTMKSLDFDKAAKMYLDDWNDIFSGAVDPTAKKTEPSDYLMIVVISLAVGIFVGIVRMNGKKRKMKTIAFAQEASTYMVANSMHLRRQDDHYVTTTVVRTPINRDKGKGGGSSDFGGFSSSGGTSFSGGGRDF